MADAENRSSTEIQQEIEATRAELDRTMEAIERKLTPGQVLDEALGYFRSRPGSGSDLANWIRENPVPVVLIGIGLAWLLFGPRSPAVRYLPGPQSRGYPVPTGPHGERRAPDAAVDVARAPDSAALDESLRRPDIPDTEVSDHYGREDRGGVGTAPAPGASSAPGSYPTGR